jgi:septal ring factor EnvC (AmiA/AmiB activator)
MDSTLAYLFAPIATAFAGWFFARKKNEADAHNSELDNVSKAIRIWRELNQDLEKKFKADIDSLRSENCELQKQVRQVVEENNSLKKQMILLEGENRKLISQLKIFNKNNPQ